MREKLRATTTRILRRNLPIAAALAVSLGLWLLCFHVADLKPRVEDTFFFARTDPQVRVDNEINREFPESDPIILTATGDIHSAGYADRVRALSDALAAIPGVTGVQSLSRGPRDIDDALKSPLWSRLIISHDRQSTLLYVTAKGAPASTIVPGVERLQRSADQPGFRVTVSGVPYVTELIARNLARDLRVFSLAAIGVFGLVLVITFRSPWVLLGTIVACGDSGAVTLMVTQLGHIPIGPLTANLSTMVFVMTLSPIVFLTFNARRASTAGFAAGHDVAREAVKRTVAPSFWSSTCMFLGFISLLFVPSTPMRHLGIAGAIGAVAAFASAYTAYPLFLAAATVAHAAGPTAKSIHARLSAFFAQRHGWIVAGVGVFALVGAYGLLRLNTDPDLPEYFKPGGAIRTGVEFVDRAGGSSPLKLVVEDRQHEPLNSSHSYHRLWALQQALEQDSAVGSVLSIATVLGEAKRPWYTFVLSTAHLVRILGEPKYGSISRQLITSDHTRTLLLLRMHETPRQVARSDVIKRLNAVVERSGFRTVQVGGAYSLLSEMARLLTSSITSGVILLIGIFVLLGFAFSRSLRVAGAMLVALAVIPVAVRGYIAYLGMPLDFITASAANIDLGMGVDAMIYLTIAARRARHGRLDQWDAWSEACSQLWRPIITSLLVICSGFGIFFLSNFPPTQRFGLFVMFGSAAATTAALFVFPWLAAAPLRRRG